MNIGNSSKPKQHIVPTKYLEGFGIPKKERTKIYVYNVKRKNGYESFADKMVQTLNFYTLGKEDADDWDDFYTKTIEPQMGRIIEELRVRALKEKGGTQDFISVKDKWYFSLCIAFQITRGEMFRKLNVETFIDLNSAHDSKYEDIFDVEFKRELAKWSTSKECNVPIMQNIANREWLFYRLNDELFITSDEPVVFTNRAGNQFGMGNCKMNNEDTVILFPISSRLMLIMLPLGKDGRFYMGRDRCIEDLNSLEIIEKCNNAQLKTCNEHVYMYCNPDISTNEIAKIIGISSDGVFAVEKS